MKRFLLLLCTFCIVFVSCSDDNGTDPNKNDDDGPINVKSTPQVVFTIDGNEYQYKEQTNVYFPGYGIQKQYNQFTYSSFMNDVSSGGIESVHIIRIERGRLVDQAVEMDVWKEIFRDFISTGEYEYSPNAEDGIAISYIDAGGKEWTTSNGAADQTGSYFRLIAKEDALENDYMVKLKVYIEFECTVYDGEGESLTLRDGKYVGYFASDMD